MYDNRAEPDPRPSWNRANLHGSRIIMVLWSFHMGGAERQALILARHLRQLGADVSMWAFDGPGPVCQICEKNGIPWRIVPFRWPSGRIERLKQLARVGRELRRECPDVILPYTLFPNVVCGLVWRGTGAKVCIWNQRDEGVGRVGRKAERCAVRLTPVFVANSHGGENFLVRDLGARQDRIRVIRNGIELGNPKLDRLAWRQRLGVGSSEFVACMVANLTKLKDHVTLLRAWRTIVDRSEESDVRPLLVLAGNLGDNHEQLLELTADLRLGQDVRFLGAVTDIPGLLSAVDLGILSSRREGCPNAVLEYMAAGLPVVGTDIPAIRECVGPEGVLFLAPQGDAETLTDRILVLATGPAKRAMLGAANRRRIQSEFGSADMCRRMSAVILESSRYRFPSLRLGKTLCSQLRPGTSDRSTFAGVPQSEDPTRKREQRLGSGAKKG